MLHLLEPGKHAEPAGSLPPGHGPRGTVIKTITNVTQVRDLARALCSLPRMPTGTVSCGPVFPGSDLLYFSAGARRLAAVTVQESGCQLVSGLGADRRASQTSLWNLLSSLAGGTGVVTSGCDPKVVPSSSSGSSSPSGRMSMACLKPWL